MVFQNSYTSSPPLFYNKNQLMETKEYNFFGILNFKGIFKEWIRKLSKKGLKALFASRGHFKNSQNLPVELSFKLFDILIRRILLYNCESWYIEEYLPIMRSIKRADKNGGVCDTLAFGKKATFIARRTFNVQNAENKIIKHQILYPRLELSGEPWRKYGIWTLIRLNWRKVQHFMSWYQIYLSENIIVSNIYLKI